MRIIDGDGHVFEDSAAMGKFLPAPFNQRVAPARWFPPLDHFHAFTGLGSPAGSFNRSVGPKEWVEFLDDVGVESTVLYTTGGLAFGKVVNLDWAIALARAYNDWLAESYLQYSPRFKAMALIPMQEPDAAVEELRRAVADLGFCGAMLPSTGLPSHLGAKLYWPVWEEANRLGCAIGIHGGAHSGFGFDDINVYTPVNAFGHPFGLLIGFAAIVFNGILDRFPNVRFGFMEGGVAWLRLALERLDRAHETHLQWNPRGELTPSPDEPVSRYIGKHMREGRLFIGCEAHEPALPFAVQQVGANPFIYSTDFPHEVNNEYCKAEIQELIESEVLPQSDKEAVFHGNAECFYGLSRPAQTQAEPAVARR